MQYEILKARLLTWKTILLMFLMAAGAVGFIARFALGLGATTHLSNNYPWGLWIVFDLVWIALAGGAFVTAGIVYVFMAEQFHALGRPAVWMGFLSYSFVVVTLVADLGLPWHFWQLGVQRPEHSAMYEVSWCIALYVTVLALEFVPAVLERFEKFWPPQSELRPGVVNWFNRFNCTKIRDLWRTLSPIYTVFALGFFVFLMSHHLWMALIAVVVFAVVAYLTRDSYQRSGVPVILVIAAITFSTMHQSSLGSLFLLMPDKLSHLWWSPIIPILFFLSAVTSGIALVMLIDLLISYFYDRPYNWKMLSQMGKVLWGALAFYYAIRIADVIIRGEINRAFSGRDGTLFLIEIIAGGIIPFVLLSQEKFRNNNKILVLGALLALLGVIFNRTNVVLLGMNLPGTLPGGLVEVYYPSLVEWTLSISLIAAAIFFYALGLKILPILPKSGEFH
jgi:formate dehydrogenase iron-sulfur subunit